MIRGGGGGHGMAGLPLALAVTHFPQAVYLRLFGTKDLGLVFGLVLFLNVFIIF